MRDVPARIVTGAARLLLGDRREWGTAMAAELEQLRDAPARWRFALGCARAALLAPRHPRVTAPGAAVTLTFLAGVAGCIATTAYVLTTWPHAANDIPRGTWSWFAGCLAAYLWIALRPPYALVAHESALRRGAAVGFALFLVTAIGRSAIDASVPPENDDVIVGIFLSVAVVGTYATTAFAAARKERSFGAGLTGALWVGLVCSMLAFNADLVAMLVGFELETHMRHVMPDHASITPAAFLSKHIGGHLSSSMEALWALPVLALIVGAVGAAIGRRVRVSPDRSEIVAP